jgi:hypothetical protein
MPNYVFKIYFNKKGEEYACDDDDYVSEPLSKFAKDKNKELEEFLFYYKGALVKYDNSIHIKDSIFSQNEGKISNIIAVLISPLPSSSISEEDNNSEEEKNIKESEGQKNEIKEEEKEEEKTEEKKEEREKKVEGDTPDGNERRRRTNREYYNDIICPKCKTTAIIDKEDEDRLSLKILNCENFHYLNNIKYNIFDDFVFDKFELTKEDYRNYNNCDLCNKKKKELVAPKNRLYYCQCGISICSECSNNKEHKTHKKIDSDDKDFTCSACNTHIKDLEQGEILYLCECGSNLCTQCKEGEGEGESEDKDKDKEPKKSDLHKKHKKININDKNYSCIKHGEKFDYYCLDCNANFCEKCKNKHQGHDIIKFSEIKPKREYVNKLKEDVDKQKTNLIEFLESIHDLFNKIINTIDSYLNSYIMIENSLIRRYKSGFYNYQLLRNLKNKKLFKNKILEKLVEINGLEDEKIKFDRLIKEIYGPINKATKEKKEDVDNYGRLIPGNEIKIIYGSENEPLGEKVKLFDPVFVENNKDKFSIRIEGKDKARGMVKEEQSLTVYFTNKFIKEIEKGKKYEVFKEKKIEVTLKEKGNKSFGAVTDMSYMFNNCKDMKSIDFRNWNSVNITSMEAMFQLCDFTQIPTDISGFNTQNLENIRAMFCKCTKMAAIPNMNIWYKNSKSTNLKNMSMLFNGCKSLNSFILPKNWNKSNNLEDISYMFNRCSNLTEIKEFSFNSHNLKNMCGLLNGCKKLSKLNDKFNDLSFNSQNLEDMSIMFQDCVALKKINVYNKYDTKTLKNISGMFSGCTSLETISNMGVTNSSGIIYMVGLFKNCPKLSSLPDLKNWTFSKNLKAKGISDGCNNNIKNPPIWWNRLKNWKDENEIIEQNENKNEIKVN